MGQALAWDVMNKVVWAKAIELGYKGAMTIYSTLDWDNGVALNTSDGVIHVLGTGEIVDENNILGYRK